MTNKHPFLKTFQETIDWLKEHKIERYKIHGDLSVDVYQNVNLSQIDLTHFPIQFGLIKGNFDCYHNQLESLIGAPHTVQGVFDITRHKLTSLKGGAKHVEQDYLAPNGSLVNLKY